MYKTITVVFIFLMLQVSACAFKSDIVPHGNSAYTFTEEDAWDKYSDSELTINASKKAISFCKTKGKKMKVVSKEIKKLKHKSITFVFSCN